MHDIEAAARTAQERRRRADILQRAAQLPARRGSARVLRGFPAAAGKYGGFATTVSKPPAVKAPVLADIPAYDAGALGKAVDAHILARKLRRLRYYLQPRHVRLWERLRA